MFSCDSENKQRYVELVSVTEPLSALYAVPIEFLNITFFTFPNLNLPQTYLCQEDEQIPPSTKC
jgi:hypothetical protein